LLATSHPGSGYSTYEGLPRSGMAKSLLSQLEGVGIL